MILSTVKDTQGVERSLAIINGFKNANGTTIAKVCTDKAEVFMVRIFADGRVECIHPQRHDCQCWHAKAILLKYRHFTADGLVDHPVPAELVSGHLSLPRAVMAPAANASLTERRLASFGLMK